MSVDSGYGYVVWCAIQLDQYRYEPAVFAYPLDALSLAQYFRDVHPDDDVTISVERWLDALSWGPVRDRGYTPYKVL